ncbi:MAG: hypothetical protein U0V18_07515 [Anaerolineales bacterium]|nr:hypothetical protein [Anaerolineales bacterium]
MNAVHALYDEGLQELLTGMLSLSTFAEAKEWSERAIYEIGQLNQNAREIDEEVFRHTQALEKLQYERSKKVLGGLLGVGKEEKELAQQIEELKTSKNGLSKAIQQLQEMMDFTPRSLDEKHALLTELKMRKRRLQEEKREITQVVRGPRLKQPHESLSEPLFNGPSRERRERRKVRYDREARLKEGETSLAALTRQIEQAERDLQWVEKFEE